MHPLAERVWGATPKVLQDAIATGIDRACGVTPAPVPLPDADKPVRLFVGPVNYAGQGYRWSRAAEETGRASARNYVHEANNPLGYEADYTVPWRTTEHSGAWQQDMVATITGHYSHVLIEACVPLLGGLYSGDMRKQIALLQEAGVKVAIVCHGTDARLPSRHATLEKWSFFHDDEWVEPELIEAAVRKNLALINELGLPTFVSTPGLLIDIPQAHFLGVIIDPERWRTEKPVLERKRIHVVHAPTNPIVKGTSWVREAATKLHDEGVIEYIELQGVPNAEMPSAFANADVVLDQFRIGDYGVAACESMAAGRVVVGHVSEQVRSDVRERTGHELPIVESAPDQLEQTLRDIASRREHYRAIAAQGPLFVEALHTGEHSRGVLMREFLDQKCA